MNSRRIRSLAIVLLLATGLAAGVSPALGNDRPSTQKPLRGGVLATFKVQGERFRVWVTNPATIQALFDLEAGNATASIPNGRLRLGPGAGRHNAPWRWHLDPEDVELSDITTEVCDATPSYVERHRAEFYLSVGRYCPWSAKLVSLQDYR